MTRLLAAWLLFAGPAQAGLDLVPQEKVKVRLAFPDLQLDLDAMVERRFEEQMGGIGGPVTIDAEIFSAVEHHLFTHGVIALDYTDTPGRCLERVFEIARVGREFSICLQMEAMPAGAEEVHLLLERFWICGITVMVNEWSVEDNGYKVTQTLMSVGRDHKLGEATRSIFQAHGPDDYQQISAPQIMPLQLPALRRLFDEIVEESLLLPELEA